MATAQPRYRANTYPRTTQPAQTLPMQQNADGSWSYGDASAWGGPQYGRAVPNYVDPTGSGDIRDWMSGPGGAGGGGPQYGRAVSNYVDPTGSGDIRGGGDWMSGPAGGGGAQGGTPPGGWQAYIQSLTSGLDPSSSSLTSLAPQLAQYGARLENPNASGITSKIILPTGEIVRVGGQFDDPTGQLQKSWTWVSQGGPGGGGGGGVGGDPGGFGGLTAPWTEPFVAPTDITEQNDPGYQNRLKLGQQALERSAAAKGTLLTGGTLKDLTQYAQDFASNEYGQVYNRALGEYQQKYGIFRNNQADAFNRMFSVAGLGLQGTTGAAGAGQNYATNTGNLLTNYGNNLTNLITGQGNATAAGQAAAGSAWGNAFGGLGNQVGGSLYGYQLLKGLNTRTPPPWTPNPANPTNE